MTFNSRYCAGSTSLKSQYAPLLLGSYVGGSHTVCGSQREIKRGILGVPLVSIMHVVKMVSEEELDDPDCGIEILEVNSKFDKDLFKLFNNSCYGKLIEDVLKRRNVAVVKSDIRAKRLTTRPQMSNFHMITSDATF